MNMFSIPVNIQIMHIKYPIGHGQTEQRIKFNTLSYPTFLSSVFQELWLSIHYLLNDKTTD